MNTKSQRIYIADDHQVLIDGLKSVLNTNQNFEVVGYALNGENLIEKVTDVKADILIMDINMPVKDGIDVLKEFSIKGYCCKVIILSSFDDIKLIKEVIKLGANGYLSKQCAGENIVEAILAVADGKEFYSDNIRNKIFESFAEVHKEYATIHDYETSITDREIDVLKLIAQEYSNKEISDTLSISIHTVETHRKNLIKKLNVKNTIGLVKYALKNNLVSQ